MDANEIDILALIQKLQVIFLFLDLCEGITFALDLELQDVDNIADLNGHVDAYGTGGVFNL